MSTRQLMAVKPGTVTSSSFTPARGAMLQRKCACGGTPGPSGECEGCRKKKLQRRSGNLSAPSAIGHQSSTVALAPPIVHDVLRSTGQPLDAATRGFMEKRFQHNFSHVRVHTDEKAANSARAVDALAYTVGRDIVFDAGRYVPQTAAGRRLLSHELTHVVQQSSAPEHFAGNLKISDASDASERVANAAAQTIDAGGKVPSAGLSASGILHRSPPGSQDDPIHRPIIEDFRRREGLPESGRDESGQRVGPSEGEIKYVLSRVIEDPAKIRIAAVPDFLASSLTATRNVNVTVNDSRVVALQWSLTGPGGATIASSATIAGQPNATTQPFSLQPAHFSGANFVAGQYKLYCYGQDQSGRSVVFARRDFNVLSADLTTGTALPTTYGELTFTRYDKTDANLPANPRYSIDVELRFLPSLTVRCGEVGFIQSMQTIDDEGRSQQNTVNAEQDARKTPLAWSIDRLAGGPTPFYGTERGAGGAITIPPGKGAFGAGGPTPSAARLVDQPSWNRVNNAKFESCAICHSGANQGQVYGCATWGYTANTAGKVTMMPRGFRQMPSDQFAEARAAWNTWRTSMPAASRPEEAPALKSP
jgi:hypothetical protein